MALPSPSNDGDPEACERILLSLSTLRDGPLHELRWQDFERHCAEVMERNGYRAAGGIWFHDGERRYQIDVVGIHPRRVICADCKAWNSGGGTHRSRKAAEEQKERTIKLKSNVRFVGLAGLDFFPLIVTLKTEGVVLHEGVAVVPFELFNAFLVDFPCYEGELFSA